MLLVFVLDLLVVDVVFVVVVVVVLSSLPLPAFLCRLSRAVVVLVFLLSSLSKSSVEVILSSLLFQKP